MSTIAVYNGDRYNIEYDFADEFADFDYNAQEEIRLAIPPRTVSPNTAIAGVIYDHLSDLFIASTNEEYAESFTALATYIQETKEAIALLKENTSICNALIAFTRQMEERMPSAIALTTTMIAQLEIILQAN